MQLRRSPDDPAAWLLTAGTVQLTRAASLGALVAALGIEPPAIARLLLDGCAFHSGGASLAACGARTLPGVTRLLISDTDGGSTALRELLPALPALRVLNLISQPLPYGLPTALCGGLHTLQASWCGLTALPEGPYLESESLRPAPLLWLLALPLHATSLPCPHAPQPPCLQA